MTERPTGSSLKCTLTKAVTVTGKTSKKETIHNTAIESVKKVLPLIIIIILINYNIMLANLWTLLSSLVLLNYTASASFISVQDPVEVLQTLS
jgi:hypothetical protein